MKIFLSSVNQSRKGNAIVIVIVPFRIVAVTGNPTVLLMVLEEDIIQS